MPRQGVAVLLFVLVCALSRPASACFKEMVSSCSDYALLNQVKIIPVLDPNRLTEVCDTLSKALRCILKGDILGRCDPLDKVPYSSISQVIQYPCQLATAEYLAGSACWSSPQLQQGMKMCYAINSVAIANDFCQGQRDFINCSTQNMPSTPGCGVTEKALLGAMLAKSYNILGFEMNPSCEELPIPTWQRLTTPTTTTTTTTTTPARFQSSSAPELKTATTAHKSGMTSRAAQTTSAEDSYGMGTQASTGRGHSSVPWTAVYLLLACFILAAL